MKKRVARTRVSHSRDHAAVATMVASLFTYGKVTVTDARAKQVRRLVDRAVTRGKEENMAEALRAVSAYITSAKTAKQVVAYAHGPGKKRNSGYTTLAKVGYRVGDGAEVTQVQLIDFEKPVKKNPPKVTKEVKK